MTLQELLAKRIDPLEESIYRKIKANWDRVAKPLNGLGRFEEMIAGIGAVLGTTDISIQKKAVLVMCADNGVVAEGISQSGQEVTAAVTRFMGQGKTSVGKMARVAGADVIPVDVGVGWKELPADLLRELSDADDLERWLCQPLEKRGLVNKRVCSGTADFLKQPAMTEEQALSAISTGIQMVRWCKEAGYTLVATGEMGIGNTTTSSAMAAAFLGCSAGEVTGRGAGLSDAGLVRKREVIDEARRRYGYQKPVEKPEEVFRVLCEVGGLDIAGLTGVCIGGALHRIPVVLDGVISVVAAVTASRLLKGTEQYLIASHAGREAAAGKLLDRLGLIPVIYGDLALGEGTGAVLLFSLLDVAMALYESETGFEQMHITQYEHFDIQEKRI